MDVTEMNKLRDALVVLKGNATHGAAFDLYDAFIQAADSPRGKSQTTIDALDSVMEEIANVVCHGCSFNGDLISVFDLWVTSIQSIVKNEFIV